MPTEDPQGQEPTTPAGQESVEPTTQTAETTGQASEPRQFTAEYVEELRKEAAQNRIKAKKAEDALKRREDADMSEAERLTKRLAELEEAEKSWATEKQTILLSQAVTSEAAKAGALYPDLLIRSLDRSAVEFDDNGKPTNLDKVIGALRKDYPAMFRSPNGSADGGTGGSAATSMTINDALREMARTAT